MAEMHSIDSLAAEINDWCTQHDVIPANGQAGESINERNIRYYRTLGLVDPPATGGTAGYGEKHCLQLKGIRLLQAQGLPLARIRDLLFGRSLAELKRIEKEGLAELKNSAQPVFRPNVQTENWNMTPLDEEFMLISRRGRGISLEMREKMLALLHFNRDVKSR